MPRPHARGSTCKMAMEYSDDDSDEDFQFDPGAAPRYVVPSYYQKLYSSHSLAQSAENDDDGWNSDDETCLPVLPEQGGYGKIMSMCYTQLN